MTAFLLIYGGLLFGRADTHQRIEKAIAVDGRLWVKYQTFQERETHAGLISLSLAENRRGVELEDGVVDIAKLDRQLWVLRRRKIADRRLWLGLWQDDRLQFEDVAELALSEGNKPLALVGHAGRPAVLCKHSIFLLIKDKSWVELRLSGEKLRGGVAISAASPQNGESLYVGFDVGEWGGGLQKIDWRTGRVAAVERRDTKDLCGGPLNRECDPVTGVIPDPLKQNCVLASVGLVHFSLQGRILRVCDSQVAVAVEFFSPPEKAGIQGREFRDSEAFYGLALRRDGGFWGITTRALYLFDGSGRKKAEYPMPKFDSVAGIRLSRAVPGVVVLQTDINSAVSLSGNTPLIVPLDN